MKKIIFMLLTAGFPLMVGAQTLTLRQCIDLAVARNVSVRQAQVGQQQQKIALESAKQARLPQVGGSFNQNLSLGRGLTANNADKLKDAGMSVAGVRWVNINNDNVVVTHDDQFDAEAFAQALHGADSSVNISKNG